MLNKCIIQWFLVDVTTKALLNLLNILISLNKCVIQWFQLILLPSLFIFAVNIFRFYEIVGRHILSLLIFNHLGLHFYVEK